MSSRSTSVVATSKRPLREVLSAGLSREDPDASRLGAKAQYDVLDSTGTFFGICYRACSSTSEYVYLEPQEMRGIRVAKPMTVSRCVNSKRLATTLGVVLSDALSM